MGSINMLEQNIVDEEVYRAFVTAHKSQLRAASVPENKWRTLCYKLMHSIFDAGNDFMYAYLESAESDAGNDSQLKVFTKCEMHPNDQEHIYLIDHAWTYTLQNAKEMLLQNQTLVERMCSIMGINSEDQIAEEIISNILHEMWKFNSSYTVRSGNQASSTVTCWFIMDEFGSRISYSEEPTFATVPFFFAAENLMYSILFPKVAVDKTDEVTVAYPRYKDSLSENMKRALKYPWDPSDFTSMSFNLLEPSISYFASGRYEDILPENESFIADNVRLTEDQLKVYSDYPEVKEFLNHPSFMIVDKMQEAHIFWLAARHYDLKALVEKYSTFRFISQFPSEQVLINKDLLAVVCRRCNQDESFDLESLESFPKWLPATFNLMTELPQFIAYYQNRERRNLSNIWICKPFNLARGLHIHVSDNINRIIRLSEVHPMVACKYITDPVLFHVEEKGLVKMDLRFIVLLKSINPLEVYMYERFWLRFANKPFSLEDFDDYEKHFTVMNYCDFPLQQMYCHDFIQKFEDYYSDYKWIDIERKIYSMVKEIFVAACLKQPPAGIGNFVSSRAMYGLDIMLQWNRSHDIPEIDPVILEVNWMPDCKRACQYYEEFYNDVFSVLFLGDIDGHHVVKL